MAILTGVFESASEATPLGDELAGFGYRLFAAFLTRVSRPGPPGSVAPCQTMSRIARSKSWMCAPSFACAVRASPAATAPTTSWWSWT